MRVKGTTWPIAASLRLSYSSRAIERRESTIADVADLCLGRLSWAGKAAGHGGFVCAIDSLPVREKLGQPLIGARPNWISFTPDSDRLFVSNSALDSVSVIDATAMKQVALVPVGSAPKRSTTLGLP